MSEKATTKVHAVDRAPRFAEKTANCLLALSKDGFGFEVVRTAAHERALQEKEEIHLTVIGSETGSQILSLLNALPSAERQQKIAALQALIESTDWSFELVDEYWYVQKDYNDPDPRDPTRTIPETRKSIIQLVHLPGMQEFYEKLNALLGTSFQTPLPHITLFTASTRADKQQRGIGLYSKEEFEALNPERLTV